MLSAFRDAGSSRNDLMNCVTLEIGKYKVFLDKGFPGGQLENKHKVLWE